MERPLKILVIRFSSIGDIVLTTPVVRCLKLQLNADIDFLTKKKYEEILISNTYISNIFSLSDDPKKIIETLRNQEYDFIIDLQSNLRSLMIRLALRVNYSTYIKKTLKRYLLIYSGINLLDDHVVDRYFKAVTKLNVFNDNQGIDYFLGSIPDLDFNSDQSYICWCIGGSYEKKKLSSTQISNVISKLKTPVLLLGSYEDKEVASKVVDITKSNNIFNFCGETSIQESAYLIKKSNLVLTNDTGMMHIASAFQSPIISFWGCTKPSLGFSPYMPAKDSENIITQFSDKPCSKHGKYCRIQSMGCIKEISSQTIYESILRLLK